MGVRTFGVNGASETPESFRLAVSGLFVPAALLNSRTGVTSVPVLTGTGNFTCTIGPFTCVVDGTSNALQGSYLAALDTAAAVTISTANTSARIDLISLQIQDNDYDSSGAHAGRILYTAGTPGSGTPPTAPVNSVSLFTVPVAANATSANFAGAVAVYPFTAAAGGIVPVRGATDQPAAVNGVQYRHRLDVTATGSGPSPLESSTNGTTWTPVSNPDGAYGAWTNATVAASFTIRIAGQTTPQYRTAPGGRIELRGAVLTNTGISQATTVLSGLPAPSNPRFMPLAISDQDAFLQINATATSATIVTQNLGGLVSNVTFAFDGLSYTTT